MFNHNYMKNYKKTDPEVNDGKSIVEDAGYIPAKTRIENMIFAGQRLAESRKENFDFQPGQDIDESFYDPTRKKNFDLAEASQQMYSTQQKISAKQKIYDQQQSEAVKASENQIEPPDGVQK
nr:MAG: hypothetical protein [Microvirus sp.]